MINKSLLISILLMAGSFSQAQEKLNSSTFQQTPFEQLKAAFENGVAPKLKDQDYAWYSGRCYWKNSTSDLPGADGKFASASLFILSKTDPLNNKPDDHGPLIKDVPKIAYTQLLHIYSTDYPADYFDSCVGKEGFLFGIWYSLRLNGFNLTRITKSGLIVHYNDNPSKKTVYEIRSYEDYFITRINDYEYCYYFKKTDYSN